MLARLPADHWLRRLARHVAVHRRMLVVACIGALATMVLSAVLPLLVRATVDRAIVERSSPLRPWIIAIVATGALRFFFAYLRRYNATSLGMTVDYDLRNALYAHLQRLDFARHDRMQTGQLVSRANGDIQLLQELIIWTPLMSSNVLLFLVSLGIMFVLSPLLSIVALLAIPLLLVITMRMSKVLYPSSWDALQWAGEVSAVVEESVTGVRVVKGFGQEQREVARFVEAANRLFGGRMRNLRITARYAPGLGVVPMIAQLLILAGGGWLAIEGRITIGTFLAFQAYLGQMIWPVRMLGQILIQAQQARAAAERVFEIFDATPEVTEAPEALDAPRIGGEVVFDDVTFGYSAGEPVLRDFSLRIAPGERVALVGASGSGKSTVALLLPRFYDVQGGTVRVDGEDVRDLTLRSLRRRIGVVFEESFLFSESVRANIAYGRPDATDDEVIAAARAAEAHEFITALPDGYDTVVGERGLTLSGGQRQRIALARALLCEPDILVLDDATSSIDVKVEEEIHRTLRELVEHRTTILIAHRRSTLDLADRIVVIEGGRVLDSGTHDELMTRCDLYRELLAGPDDVIDEVAAAHPVGRTEAAWTSPELVLEGEVPVRAQLTGAGDELGPELVEALKRLPPIVDEPHVDLTRELEHDPHFSLRSFVRPYAAPMAVGLSLVVLSGLTELSGPAIIRRGVDAGITRGSTSGLWGATLVFVATIVASFLLHRAVIVFTSRTAQRLLLALRVRVFAHLQRLGLDFYEREMAGRIMTRVTSDVEALNQFLSQGLLNALMAIVVFVGSVGILLAMNATLALATLSIVVPLAAITRWFQKRSDTAFLEARDKLASVNAAFQESISGVRVAQAYVREQRNTEDFRSVVDSMLASRLEGAWLGSIYFPFIEGLQAVATGVVLWLGAGMVHSGELTTGALIAFVLYLAEVFWPIQQLSQVFETYQQAKAATRKIADLLREPVQVVDKPGALDPGRVRGDITFEQVHFKYPTADVEALSGIDLSVLQGETVALVGETGAGKSTIVKLIARFYDPVSGAVRVDGNDLRDVDLGAYRRRLGYVPQEAFLFTGSIRDNIAYGRPDASDQEVEAAARAVGAHDFISRLPHGYLQPVTERGRSLSAGQRQLIALARALLVDPSILLLDEATANLDLMTEARVAGAMGLVSRGRTTVLIAHRLATARRADRILVIDHGHVVEQGSHDDLVLAGGRYAELWRAFEMGAAEPV